MKTLYLTRHAKAVKEGYDRDFYRGLRSKGIEDAETAGKYYKHKELCAQITIASTAVRSLQTAELICRHTKETLIEDQRLYFKGVESIMELLREQQNGVQSLRLVGHNPNLEELAGLLIGGGDIHIATCGTVSLCCNINEWVKLERGTCQLEWSIRPIHF